MACRFITPGTAFGIITFYSTMYVISFKQLWHQTCVGERDLSKYNQKAQLSQTNLRVNAKKQSPMKILYHYPPALHLI